MQIKSVLILLITIISNVQCYQILIVAPMPAYSHFSILFRLAKELADRGHKVTCINPYPQVNPIPNYTDVSVEENIAAMQDIKNRLFDKEKMGILKSLTSMFDMVTLLVEATLKHKNVQKLLTSNQNFDLVIMEHFLNEAFMGFGYHFKAPIILVSATCTNAVNNGLFANPAPLSYVPGIGGTLTRRMNFWQRLKNFLLNSVFYGWLELYHLPHQKELLNKYFKPECDLDDIVYNASLLLTNSHPSVSDPVPHVPSIIEIGGFHIKPSKKLPENIQNFLDDSKEGVILFSMGSNLQSKDLKPEVRDEILRAFSKIKQKILWKFETDLPGVPGNIKIMKWVPQQDVLAHPNVKTFVSHGGFLSTLEAVYFGVPIIGIPVFGDQNYNVATAVLNGYAIGIDLDDVTEEKLSWALNEILKNPKYKENVQQRSKLMHDRPLKPIDSAVFWIEHVIPHRGAPHLKSAGLELKWYQREMIDIILFLIVVVILIPLIFHVAIKTSFRFLSRTKNALFVKLKKNKQH